MSPLTLLLLLAVMLLSSGIPGRAFDGPGVFATLVALVAVVVALGELLDDHAKPGNRRSKR